MSWSMPNPGQWNPVTTPEMNMGCYGTPEQWAAMQQQNWHQWAQWQQQYAQWQSQYGEKYAEQMQSLQTSGMPPLPPTSAPPPAPPPPDKPPPPPPHENNQPLYGQPTNQPAPVPAPSHNQRNTNPQGYNNNFSTGNNQNWSYAPEAPLAADVTQPSVNAEALKKLAEEERLFDIQFQKWEEEIEKWRRENVNHPDKQAYKEYEQKFEACRVQLLERRQQMKQKRARLLGHTPQVTSIAGVGNIKAPAQIPPPLQNTNNNYKNMQPQNHQNKPQNFLNQNNSQYTAQQQYNEKPVFNKGNNKNIDPQDRFESYEDIEDYTSTENFTKSDKNSFLSTNASANGIPGLDLVPENDKGSASDKQGNIDKLQDVIDITEDHTDNRLQTRGPDYSTISKGINNILGDEKIMNILSMVHSQNVSSGSNSQNPNGPNSGSYTVNSNNVSQNNQWNKNDVTFNNQQYGNMQNIPYNRPDPNFLIHQNQPVQKRLANDNRQIHPQEYYGRDDEYEESHIPPQPGPPSRPNMPQSRPPLQEVPARQNEFNYNRGMHDQQVTQDNRMIDNRGMQENRNLNVNRGMHGARNMPENRNIHDNRGTHENDLPGNQPVRVKWVDEPLFTPSIIVEYEHKPLRLKARDFIEPVHMFDYNHTSKDEEYKKKDFEKEANELFTRKPKKTDRDEDRLAFDRVAWESQTRDYERRTLKDDFKDDFRPRVPRDEYDDRRRFDKYDDRRRDDRDKYTRREDLYRDLYRDRDRDLNREKEFSRERDRDFNRERDLNRERDKDYNRERDKDLSRDRERDINRDRDLYRDRFRDLKRDETVNRSSSREKDTRKRGHSKESELSDSSKKLKEDFKKVEQPKHIVMIDDILEIPGRDMRPEKIVIILRGPPGSGKSYLAKLIRDREAEYGGTARIMSIDDYFMQEGEIEEKDPVTGKIVKKPVLKYEYDEKLEESYMTSLKRAFNRSITDGYFTFLIYDAVNDQLKSYANVWNFARQNGFQVYICTMELDPQICFKRNIHNRTLEDIQVICSRFFPTPAHHIVLDPTTLLQSAAIPDVQMEDATDDVIMEDEQETEVDSIFTSKWEKMDDAAQLARLDGTNKPLRPSQLSMADYLQLDDWTPNKAKPGKKTVRWADLEERREQEKMRAIGFVVGQTDWNRMTDPTMGSSALTQTKFIERVRRH